jgi:hypothetical protein
MRLLIEIVVAGALIALAWQKSFRDWVSDVPGIGSHLTAPAQTPQKNSVAAPATTGSTPHSFTGHIYYTDEHGKKYWVDAQNRRHYEP